MPQPLQRENLDEPITRYMRTDFVTLSTDQTVAGAMERLRALPTSDQILYLYAVDAGGALVGVVPTRRLLTSRPDQRIGQIMQDRVVSLPAGASVMIACEFFVLYRYLAFPVIDAANRLIGVVDVSLFTDEVFNLAEQREQNDVFQLIGVHIAAARQGSPLRSFRERFPWLLCNVGGGLTCAVIAALFEPLLDSVIMLALFVPIVLALAESVSVQSVTITLANRHARLAGQRFARALAREFAVAAMLGLVCGSLVGGIAWAWRGQFTVAAAIALAIVLSMLTACLLGVILPSAINRFRGDPRIAAGPITLAIADIATLLFYFALAGAILS